ncbi:hypothetical protein BH20ACI4_BH20ACI4_31340 [soil metagenome]
MKNFVVLSVFISTMIFGLAISDLFKLSSKMDNFTHQNCVRWGDDTFEKPLFTLQEAKFLLRKKVISKKENFRKGEIGRIMRLEMVGQDKFLVEIYWGNGATDENSLTTLHGPEWFPKDFEIVD